VPQPPPFRAPRGETVPGAEDRPPPGSPREVAWFRRKLREIGNAGPVFGPRATEFLPYLLVRGLPGDQGARPIEGAFWESPDIFVAANQPAETAPPLPPTRAGVAQASAPNTLYAHVWNLGKAPAYGVRVEFYWCNPSVGLDRYKAHLVGVAHVDLGNRFALSDRWTEVHGPQGAYVTRGCHVIVRCPTTWVPHYENNGHECLVVRVSDPLLDPVAPDQFSAHVSRLVAQRNIAVVQAASPAAIDLTLDLGQAAVPAEAELLVEVVPPVSMEWLKLYTGRADPRLAAGSARVVAGFLPPTAWGARAPRVRDVSFEHRPSLLHASEQFHRGCDRLQAAFHASVEGLQRGEANVVRVRQRVDGKVIGGYTVVLMRT
jgi:hypothetical protein